MNFEAFVKQGVVVRQAPDPRRADSLVQQSESRLKFIERVVESLPEDEIEPNFIIESCYDVIMYIIRAAMLRQGFRSRDSHEAEVAFSSKLGLGDVDVALLDELRYFRNRIKYDGKPFGMDYALKVRSFLNRVYTQLKNA